MARPQPFATQPAWTPDDDHALLGLYVKGTPLTDYAAALGYHETTVRRAMGRLGLEPLGRGRPLGRQDCDHTDRRIDRHRG